MRALVAGFGCLVAAVAFARGARAAPDDAQSNAATAEDRVAKRVTGFGTVALGMPGPDFVNGLAGARLELAYTPRFSFGLSAAYANLKGKDGRVSNVLPEASVAYRLPVGASDFSIPFRFSGGYLAMNGPTLRFTSGVELAVTEAAAIELALLEPMVWVARDRPELSLNFGAAVGARF